MADPLSLCNYKSAANKVCKIPSAGRMIQVLSANRLCHEQKGHCKNRCFGHFNHENLNVNKTIPDTNLALNEITITTNLQDCLGANDFVMLVINSNMIVDQAHSAT